MRWKIAPPGRDSNSRPLDYIPCALTAGLREYATSQVMVWDTGSGDIDILFVKVNIRNANRARSTAPISFFDVWG